MDPSALPERFAALTTVRPVAGDVLGGEIEV